MKLGIKQWMFKLAVGVFVGRVKPQPPPSDDEAFAEEEFRRVLAMTDEEVQSSLRSKGFDFDEIDARMREMLRPMFPKQYPLH